ALGVAGCFLRMHAGERLEERSFGFVFVAFVIGVDAYPMQLAAARDLFLADDGDVVFRLAGNYACVAADATVQVDRHAPRIAKTLILVIEILIKRELVQLFLLRLALL